MVQATTVVQPGAVDPMSGKLPHVPSQQSVLDVNRMEESPNSPGGCRERQSSGTVCMALASISVGFGALFLHTQHQCSKGGCQTGRSLVTRTPSVREVLTGQEQQNAEIDSLVAIIHHHGFSCLFPVQEVPGSSSCSQPFCLTSLGSLQPSLNLPVCLCCAEAQAVAAIMQKIGSASAAERQAAAKEVVEQVKSSGVTGLVVSCLVPNATLSRISEGLLHWFLVLASGSEVSCRLLPMQSLPLWV